MKKVKETGPAISAGVSNLLTQEDLSWAKIRPRFKSEKPSPKGEEPASQTAILAEKEAALAIQKDASIPKNAVSWDQLLLPGMAIVLVSLLAGYKFGQQQNASADPKLHGEALCLLDCIFPASHIIFLQNDSCCPNA